MPYTSFRTSVVRHVPLLSDHRTTHSQVSSIALHGQRWMCRMLWRACIGEHAPWSGRARCQRSARHLHQTAGNGPAAKRSNAGHAAANLRRVWQHAAFSTAAQIATTLRQIGARRLDATTKSRRNIVGTRAFVCSIPSTQVCSKARAPSTADKKMASPTCRCEAKQARHPTRQA
eukprot:6187083-Pleurochrysis_carterae.AAC.3